MPAIIGRSAVTPILSQPSLRSEQVSQLVLGESGRVLAREGEWRRIRADLDGYEGWVHSGYVLEVDKEEATRWRSAAEGWSCGATLQIDGQVLRLPLRARVELREGAVRLPDGRLGRLTDGLVPRAGDNRAAARARSPERWALEHFAGSPYEWGGVTSWGVDCSGLVQTTFAARGTVLPRDSARQAALGSPVLPDAIHPGDLLFFRGEPGGTITHVAFAGEGDTLVHSTVACGGVVVESWLPGSRAAPLREQLEAVRRMEGG